MKNKMTPREEDDYLERLKEQNDGYHYKKYWCHQCQAQRNHEMVTEEKGVCVFCQSTNYAPLGDLE